MAGTDGMAHWAVRYDFSLGKLQPCMKNHFSNSLVSLNAVFEKNLQ